MKTSSGNGGQQGWMLVESSSTVRDVLERPEFQDARLWSTSTGIAAVLGRGVESPEMLVGERDFDKVSLKVVEATDLVENRLKEISTVDRRFTGCDRIFTLAVRSTLQILAIKGLVLEALLKAAGDRRLAVVGHPTLSPVSGMNIDIGRYDHVFATLAREADTEAQTVATDREDPSAFNAVFHKVSGYDRFMNILSRSFSGLLYKGWVYFGSPAIGTGRRGTALLAKEERSIEDAFLGLLFDGWRLRYLPFRISRPVSSCAIPGSAANAIDDLRNDVSGVLSSVLDPAMAMAVARISTDRLREGLGYYPTTVEQSASLVAREMKNDPKIRVVLSNGLFGPVERIIAHEFMRGNIPVICADHGSSLGIPAFLTHTIHRYRYDFCTRFLAYNSKVSSIQMAHRPTDEFHSRVGGAPADLLYPRLRRFKRFLARRHLRIPLRSRCAVYVSTLENNNVHHGFGQGSDADLARVQAGVVESLGSFDGVAIVKPYPVNRYPDPGLVHVTPRPDNTRLASHGEFRNIRLAADLIVTEASVSTLGVVLSVGCPVVFVTSEHSRVTPSARNLLEKAVFVVDTSRAKWKRKLAGLLALPPDELSRGWREKAIARGHFIDKRIASRACFSSEALREEARQMTVGYGNPEQSGGNERTVRT